MAEPPTPPPMPWDGEGFSEVQGREAVDYALQTLQAELTNLSNQCDLKANIVITSSILVLSLAITRFGDEELRWGAIPLSVGCVIALACAIIVVLPNEAKADSPVDPFFFQSIAFHGPEAYERLMRQVLATDAALYATIVQSVHGYATYLAHHKFRIVRRAYIALLTGAAVALVLQGAYELTN